LTESEGKVSGEVISELPEWLENFSSFEEVYIRHYISLADAKATFFCSLYFLVIGGLVSDASVRKMVANAVICVDFSATILTFIFLFLGAGSAFSVVAPRLRSSNPQGFIFFDAVASFEDGDHYTMELLKLSDSDISRERLAHCYDVAKVCARKYSRLRFSIWMTPPSLALACWVKFVV
tara:strand:+ start:1294 stop:1830 length:537 start_codon:yes stop_codon:yes gene_type:complete